MRWGSIQQDDSAEEKEGLASLWRRLRVELGKMGPDESGGGSSLPNGRHENRRKLLVIPGTAGNRLQRRIKIEAGPAVLVFSGEAGNRFAGAIIRPLAAGFVQSIFQRGMAVGAEAQDKAEGAGLPGEEKGQKTDGRK